MALKLHSSFTVHPGVWLRTAIVEAHRLNVTVTAGKLKLTTQAMSNLLNGRAGLSADMVIRFENAFGVRADTLVRMQAAHDLAQARAHEGDIEVEQVAAELGTWPEKSLCPSFYALFGIRVPAQHNYFQDIFRCVYG